MTKTKIMHLDSALVLSAYTQRGWQLIKTDFHHGDTRMMGGWWIYRGDDAEALDMLEERKKFILAHGPATWERVA
jgi:hypothetical protein